MGTSSSEVEDAADCIKQELQSEASSTTTVAMTPITIAQQELPSMLLNQCTTAASSKEDNSSIDDIGGDNAVGDDDDDMSDVDFQPPIRGPVDAFGFYSDDESANKMKPIAERHQAKNNKAPSSSASSLRETRASGETKADEQDGDSNDTPNSDITESVEEILSVIPQSWRFCFFGDDDFVKTIRASQELEARERREREKAPSVTPSSASNSISSVTMPKTEIVPTRYTTIGLPSRSNDTISKGEVDVVDRREDSASSMTLSSPDRPSASQMNSSSLPLLLSTSTHSEPISVTPQVEERKEDTASSISTRNTKPTSIVQQSEHYKDDEESSITISFGRGTDHVSLLSSTRNTIVEEDRTTRDFNDSSRSGVRGTVVDVDCGKEMDQASLISSPRDTIVEGGRSGATSDAEDPFSVNDHISTDDPVSTDDDVDVINYDADAEMGPSGFKSPPDSSSLDPHMNDVIVEHSQHQQLLKSEFNHSLPPPRPRSISVVSQRHQQQRGDDGSRASSWSNRGTELRRQGSGSVGSMRYGNDVGGDGEEGDRLHDDAQTAVSGKSSVSAILSAIEDQHGSGLLSYVADASGRSTPSDIESEGSDPVASLQQPYLETNVDEKTVQETERTVGQHQSGAAVEGGRETIEGYGYERRSWPSPSSGRTESDASGHDASVRTSNIVLSGLSSGSSTEIMRTSSYHGSDQQQPVAEIAVEQRWPDHGSGRVNVMMGLSRCSSASNTPITEQQPFEQSGQLVVEVDVGQQLPDNLAREKTAGLSSGSSGYDSSVMRHNSRGAEPQEYDRHVETNQPFAEMDMERHGNANSGRNNYLRTIMSEGLTSGLNGTSAGSTPVTRTPTHSPAPQQFIRCLETDREDVEEIDAEMLGQWSDNDVGVVAVGTAGVEGTETLVVGHQPLSRADGRLAGMPVLNGGSDSDEGPVVEHAVRGAQQHPCGSHGETYQQRGELPVGGPPSYNDGVDDLEAGKQQVVDMTYRRPGDVIINQDGSGRGSYTSAYTRGYTGVVSIDHDNNTGRTSHTSEYINGLPGDVRHGNDASERSNVLIGYDNMSANNRERNSSNSYITARSSSFVSVHHTSGSTGVPGGYDAAAGRAGNSVVSDRTSFLSGYEVGGQETGEVTSAISGYSDLHCPSEIASNGKGYYADDSMEVVPGMDVDVLKWIPGSSQDRSSQNDSSNESGWQTSEDSPPTSDSDPLKASHSSTGDSTTKETVKEILVHTGSSNQSSDISGESSSADEKSPPNVPVDDTSLVVVGVTDRPMTEVEEKHGTHDYVLVCDESPGNSAGTVDDDIDDDVDHGYPVIDKAANPADDGYYDKNNLYVDSSDPADDGYYDKNNLYVDGKPFSFAYHNGGTGSRTLTGSRATTTTTTIAGAGMGSSSWWSKATSGTASTVLIGSDDVKTSSSTTRSDDDDDYYYDDNDHNHEYDSEYGHYIDTYSSNQDRTRGIGSSNLSFRMSMEGDKKNNKKHKKNIVDKSDKKKKKKNNDQNNVKEYDNDDDDENDDDHNIGVTIGFDIDEESGKGNWNDDRMLDDDDDDDNNNKNRDPSQQQQQQQQRTTTTTTVHLPRTGSAGNLLASSSVGMSIAGGQATTPSVLSVSTVMDDATKTKVWSFAILALSCISVGAIGLFITERR